MNPTQSRPRGLAGFLTLRRFLAILFLALLSAAVPLRAHESGPLLIEGDVGDIQLYYIISDVQTETNLSHYFIRGGFDTNVVSINPSFPFDVTGNGIWYIHMLAPGDITVHFNWAYTNHNAAGEFDVRIVVHPAGTTVGTGANFPFSVLGADPVNMFTGEFTLPEAPDLHLGGPMRLQFMRYYASGIARDALGPPSVGTNWRHNFEWFAARTTNDVQIFTFEGRRIRFTRTNGVWQLADQPAITPFQLVDIGADIQLGDPRNQKLYTFNASGLLNSISDGRGNTHGLTYNGTLLQTVTDGLGRTLTFTYSGFGQLTSVSDGTRSVGFGHVQSGNDSLLTSVTNALGNVTRYGYGATNAITALLTSKTNALGNVSVAQTYDASGRVVTQTDGNGFISRLNYNTNTLTTTITNPFGNTRVYVHSSTGATQSMTDEAGKTASWTYNGSGQQTAATDRRGNTIQVTYHAASGKIATQTDPNGGLTTFSYSTHLTNGIAFYEPSQITHADGTTDSYTYDGGGNVLAHTDPSGATWNFTYNTRGQVVSARNPRGGLTSYSYDGQGNVATHQDSDVGVTGYAYDGLSRLITITNADNSIATTTWDAGDRLIATVDEVGNTNVFIYDNNNNLAQMQDAFGNSTTFGFDGADHMVRRTNRLGEVVSRRYGALDQVLVATNGNGFVTAFTYDSRQRLTTRTDPGGQNWSTGYDDENNPTSFTNPLNEKTRLGLDKLGMMIRGTNALGHVSSMVRDTMERVTASIDTLNRTNTYAYDARGLPTTTTKPIIGTGRLIRDVMGLVTNITDLNSNTWKFTRSTMGRITSKTDPLNRATTYGYDARGRVIRAAYADGSSQTNTWDGFGNLLRLSCSAGPDLSYTFDSRHLMLAAGSDLTFSYDAEGKIIETTDFNDAYSAAYDAGGRLAAVRYQNNLFAVFYTYDSRDRLTRVTDNRSGTQIDFTYDEANRLTSITRSNGVTTTYTYDGAGRLTRIRDGGFIDLQMTLDDAAQITAVNFTAPLDPSGFSPTNSAVLTYDAAHQISNAGYTYDSLGRLIVSPGHGFQWNGLSQLTAVDAVTFTYSGLGYRSSRTQSGVTTRYFRNYAMAGAPIMTEQNATLSQNTRFYVWMPDGRLLYSIDPVNGNAVRHYHFDKVGSTLSLTDSNGAVTDSYVYNAYGVLLGHTGTSTQPFTFVGRYGVLSESAANLYLMGNRYYDPVTARFLSPDPEPQDEPSQLDPYQYAVNNPVSNIDPTGGSFVRPNEPLFHFGWLGAATGLISLGEKQSNLAAQLMTSAEGLNSNVGQGLLNLYQKLTTFGFSQSGGPLSKSIFIAAPTEQQVGSYVLSQYLFNPQYAEQVEQITQLEGAAEKAAKAAGTLKAVGQGLAVVGIAIQTGVVIYEDVKNGTPVLLTANDALATVASSGVLLATPPLAVADALTGGVISSGIHNALITPNTIGVLILTDCNTQKLDGIATTFKHNWGTKAVYNFGDKYLADPISDGICWLFGIK